MEDNSKAVGVKPTGEESSELDAPGAPAPLYPHRFNDNLVDAGLAQRLTR